MTRVTESQLLMVQRTMDEIMREENDPNTCSTTQEEWSRLRIIIRELKSILKN